MFKEWAEDIRTKTENMDRKQKAEYVLTYYWYHILLFALLIGIIILVIYHVGWGNQKKDFTFCIVNQQVDFERDETIADGFSKYSNIKKRKIQVDSDYLISYGDVKLEGVNESSYDKFFFNWSAGAIDVIAMPESFLRYCKSQAGEVEDLKELLSDKELQSLEECIYEKNGRCEGIYIEETILSGMFKETEDDRMILVFPKDIQHKKTCYKFLEYILKEHMTEAKGR